ncbi:MAG: choline-sulfatase, partial [Rhodovibrionaceae bacterium]
RPFALVASFTHPHDPYAARPEFWDLYADSEIDPPAVAMEPEFLDPHSKRLRRVIDIDGKEPSPEQVLRARRAYYANISYIDDKVGRLLASLEELGLAEDTIVVFTGDHGDMLGERGLWYKMSWFDPSSRVPLVVSHPQSFAPRRVAQSVSLIDLLPTLTEVAGDGQAPELAAPIDGRSLLPHLSGSGGHDEAIGEYCGEGAIAPVCMIRRGDLKYICSGSDPDQLFDLAADPHELEDLTRSEAAAEPLAAFRREAAERWDMEAFRARVIASQRRRLFVAESLRQGRLLSWDFQPGRDASRQFMRNHLDLDDVEAGARLEAAARGRDVA